MNLALLIRKRRVHPILENDEYGITCLHGWVRPDRSRKDGEWHLKKPVAWVDKQKIADGRDVTPGCKIIAAAALAEKEDLAGYSPAELMAAGQCYFTPAENRVCDELPGATATSTVMVPKTWPFHARDWQPGDRLREVVHSGALFLTAANVLREAGMESEALQAEGLALAAIKEIDDHYKVGPLSPGEELIDIDQFQPPAHHPTNPHPILYRVGMRSNSVR